MRRERSRASMRHTQGLSHFRVAARGLARDCPPPPNIGRRISAGRACRPTSRSPPDQEARVPGSKHRSGGELRTGQMGCFLRTEYSFISAAVNSTAPSYARRRLAPRRAGEPSELQRLPARVRTEAARVQRRRHEQRRHGEKAACGGRSRRAAEQLVLEHLKTKTSARDKRGAAQRRTTLQMEMERAARPRVVIGPRTRSCEHHT
jgi:hypothetical protein